ncbi:MAG: 4Fe-4S dicluster domain-containing protein, partial [bacterium]|nr:4Fe-4S dicluster domain-containing protein [bacterium]
MSLIVDVAGLEALFKNLQQSGYELVGPTISDEAIVYDRLESSQDLPIGWTEEQEAGRYRLKRRKDQAFFGYAVGPHSWKKYLQPPVHRLWKAKREGGSFKVHPEPDQAPRFAFIGVRACELHGIKIQDKVFLGQKFQDPVYGTRRENCFLLAVNCSQAGGTCFCVSMNTGPQVEGNFDLALTEILEKDRHYFLIDVGSVQGEKALKGIQVREADDAEIRAGQKVLENTAASMGRSMDINGIKDLLYQNYEHPRWENVAERCLSCANCTMVCPTCFCTTVEDVTDLSGDHAERWQKWDSCFTMDFSYLNGAGSVRSSTLSRYRQWMTHKLSTWIDQF